MARKETKSKKKTTQEVKLYKTVFLCSLLCIAVVCSSYLVVRVSNLKPQINEETANYISFNNSNTTDMLKISKLNKLSDKKGIGKTNTKSLEFEITGKKESKYNIIVYPINNKNDLSKIKLYLTENDKEVEYNSLDNMTESVEDGGIIIHQGEVSDSKFKLRMWLTKDYHENSDNISFEVKVKAR